MANYTYLVNELIAATENDSTEFLNFIPNMVNRAEERLVKDLDDYGLVTYTSVAVSSGNNKVTDFCYDLLFNACMVEASMFQKDYQTAGLYQQQYSQVLDLQRNQARRTRRDDMQAPASPAGADDNLVPNSN